MPREMGDLGQCGPHPGLSTSLSPQQTLLSRRRDHGERYPSKTVLVLTF